VDTRTRLTNNANAWLWLSVFPEKENVIELKVRGVRDSVFQVRLLVGDPLMKGGGKTNLEWTPLTAQISLAPGEQRDLALTIANEQVLRALPERS